MANHPRMTSYGWSRFFVFSSAGRLVRVLPWKNTCCARDEGACRGILADFGDRVAAELSTLVLRAGEMPEWPWKDRAG